jgi:hypothetical protein
MGWKVDIDFADERARVTETVPGPVPLIFAVDEALMRVGIDGEKPLVEEPGRGRSYQITVSSVEGATGSSPRVRPGDRAYGPYGDAS